jgi:hypothetical protein
LQDYLEACVSHTRGKSLYLYKVLVSSIKGVKAEWQAASKARFVSIFLLCVHS